jgi:hypothetical protein
MHCAQCEGSLAAFDDDLIIKVETRKSVGFCCGSVCATEFRQWNTTFENWQDNHIVRFKLYKVLGWMIEQLKIAQSWFRDGF